MTNITEKLLQKHILDLLSSDFEIEEQVKGKHFSGAKLKIDAIIIPKVTVGWKDEIPVLGLEFKNNLRLKGDTKNYTKWLAQCIDYSHTEWGEYGYIYVFACPGLIEGLPYQTDVDPTKNDPDSIQWLLPRIMSQLGVGELKNSNKYGWTFYLQNEHRIWSQKEGVREGNRWSLTRKFGSR